MKEIPYFAFRKEYFGGLFLNYKNNSFMILSDKEYNFLLYLKKRKEFPVQCLKDPKLNNFVQILKSNKVIRVNSNKKKILIASQIRKIKEPKNPPKDYLSAPIKVYNTYTRKCNLSCKHCYASARPDFIEKRMNIYQLRTAMNKFYNVGVIEWNFTGGEPTIMPDFLEAVKIAKSFRMKVSLNTNGCWSPIISKRIFDLGIDEFIISVDGKEKTHDGRHGQGTFKRVIRTLDKIYSHSQNKGKGVKVILNMTVGRDNVKDIDFVVKLGLKYNYDVKLVPLRPAGRAPKTLILSTREYMNFARKVQDIRENPDVKGSPINIILNHQDLFSHNYPDKSNLPYPFNFSQCTALTTAMDILPDGKTVACSFLMDRPEFIGPNILRVSVYDAWTHPKMELFRKSQKKRMLTM